MKVVQIQESFGLDRLAVAERPDPAAPGPGQVLLRMEAASLNYRDLLMVQGKYNPGQPLPLIPGSDGCGSVVEIGEGVGRVRVGDRVCPIFCPEWISGEPTRDKIRTTLGGPLDGTLCEHMVLSQESVVAAPAHLSSVEAATLPCAAVTAWNALHTHGGLRAGETVLVQGSGGVSIFALQFASMLGAQVIATSSRDDRLDRLLEMGAASAVNYRKEPEWGKLIRGMTGGRGVDLVVEVAGADSLQQSLQAVRIGGRIILLGVLSSAAAELNIIPAFMKQVRIQGMLVGSRDDFEAMNRAVSLHRLRPAVSQVFELEEAPQALQSMQRGDHFGKICIRIASDG
jgi:NADPH:quinone reductase-like Zn-dependent oxidoreductase